MLFFSIRYQDNPEDQAKKNKESKEGEEEKDTKKDK